MLSAESTKYENDSKPKSNKIHIGLNDAYTQEQEIQKGETNVLECRKSQAALCNPAENEGGQFTYTPTKQGVL